MPDVRTLAPPDAKNIIFTKTRIFWRFFFDYLVSGVILRSLGRIEFGPNSKLKGKPEPPPLNAFLVEMKILSETDKV